MARRVPLQKLRGSDPVLLEVQIQDLLNRPMSQLEPDNLCDLFALAELEAPPKTIALRLQKFVDRAREEMADLPEGASITDFVDELGAVEATRVPQTLRAHLVGLADRESRDPTALRSLLSALEGTEPAVFELGAGVTKAEKAKPSAGAAKTARATGKTPTRRVASKPVVDEERHEFICQLAMKRLESSANNSLGEAVLVAGVRHRAKVEYPKVLPQEVGAALNDLLKKGLVRKSAGRWSSARRR